MRILKNRASWLATTALVTLALAGACSGDDVATNPQPTGTGGTGAGGGTGATGGDPCPPGLLECGGQCVDPNYNPAHCGACDSPCNQGEVCSLGQCGFDCAGGTTKCGDMCVDTNLDPAHCGGCDSPCDPDQVCSAGQCSLGCVGGTILCDGLCVDPEVDPTNCGGCGDDPNPGDNICAQGEVCSAGQCGLSCVGGTTDCNGLCVDIMVDPGNCGGCGNDPNAGDNICDANEVCSAGQCGLQCLGGTTDCNGLCVDLVVDPGNCGGCANDPNPGDNICDPGEVCSTGQCGLQCAGGTTECSGLCVDLLIDPANCGGCANDPNVGDNICGADEVCLGGACTSVCGGTLTKCGNSCVDTTTNFAHCGDCFDPCDPGQQCINSVCQDCDSAVTDCDSDGWLVSEGDCCDKPGLCGNQPELVNPGAIEVLGNGVDDNCNGLADLFDTQDTLPCDTGLSSNSADPLDYARTLGLCRQTTENPPMDQKTWGLIDAQLLRADGSALAEHDTHSIRGSFGSVTPATLEGTSLMVLSSGIAADGSQTLPGPNGGAPLGSNVSSSLGSSVDILNCGNSLCINDWYSTPNPPLKAANELPVAPNCGQGLGGDTANDSVMLYLRLRAPTNAKAFSFNSYFFSAEYAEYVCTSFNDQLVALVDTPSGPPQPIPNPVDKNLMTYSDGQNKWPVGINIAAGTSLFSVCETQADNPGCWNADVDAASCSFGAGQLAGTGFETPNAGTCTIGGGTYWLTTSGNVVPGEIIELRIVIWDVGDSIYDSLALVDGFQWLANATTPGTS